MDIKDILAALNIDQSDADAVEGAVQALNALKTGTDVWPPPPPPPPTDPPLPPPPKKPDLEKLKKREKRRKGSNKGRGPGDLPDDPIDDADLRSITYNRTLEAAKDSLEKAEAAGLDPDKIKALRDAIADMEQLTESIKPQSIQDMSQDEFDGVINKTLEAIIALGLIDDELKIDSEDEHEAKVQRLADILKDDDIIDALDDEDEEERARDIERQQNLARINRNQNNYYYGGNKLGKYGGFEDFVNSLYKAIMLQVQIAEQEEDTWTAIDKRYHNSGVLKKGTKINEIPSERVPIIDFYFDVSASWEEEDIAMGRKAQNALSILESKGKIKLNTFYFSNGVSADYGSVAGGGTYAWRQILQQIRDTHASNVVIMTDSDMNGQAGAYGQIEVPGCVWYLWKNGIDAPKITKDLLGKRGTMQFTFTSQDAIDAYEEEKANNANS
jgi:hypothetical protein